MGRSNYLIDVKIQVFFSLVTLFWILCGVCFRRLLRTDRSTRIERQLCSASELSWLSKVVPFSLSPFVFVHSTLYWRTYVIDPNCWNKTRLLLYCEESALANLF